MAGEPLVDLVFIWHHHQPDYRSPRDGRASLPWVRLHATKDYLDMALHLERFPGIKSTFNFVPSLLDQLDDVIAGKPDALFDLIERPVAELSDEERRVVCRRCGIAPRWARDRWRRFRTLADRLSKQPGSAPDADIVALQCGFLVAWLDPMFHGEPAAVAALQAIEGGAASEAQRDALLALHARLAARVVPAYRALAERGQIELSESAYYHPILPLLCDVRAARRARPDLPLPTEPFQAADDARAQVERALARHERAFGSRPVGMWPPEGSVSPEALEVLAGAGVRWAATDEGVLWQSLPPAERHRGVLYQPWRVETPAGEVALFFRDHELSDRIGFVYSRWSAAEAVADFLARLRRIGAEHAARGGGEPAVVTVILDGENCWENYDDDGRPFLEGLYGALSQAGDIRTRTPSECLASGRPAGRLTNLHSGSWIDADFHIWCGHPEKNRAWDLVARCRAALLAAGTTAASHPAAWESLYAAEGSDWFWWFGEDHYTSDKTLFDRIFREHVQAAYERAGLPLPTWVTVPITRGYGLAEGHTIPVGFVRPTLDGRSTQYYEWQNAGRYRLDAGGGSMHHGGVERAKSLYYGFDERTLYVRLDLLEAALGADRALTIEVLAPEPKRLVVRGLVSGDRPVMVVGADGTERRLEGARCTVGPILEFAAPFAPLGAAAGQWLELLLHLTAGHEHLESLPHDEIVRLCIPGPEFEKTMWSV